MDAIKVRFTLVFSPEEVFDAKERTSISAVVFNGERFESGESKIFEVPVVSEEIPSTFNAELYPLRPGYERHLRESENGDSPASYVTDTRGVVHATLYLGDVVLDPLTPHQLGVSQELSGAVKLPNGVTISWERIEDENVDDGSASDVPPTSSW
jgi:hypothetical protein